MKVQGSAVVARSTTGFETPVGISFHAVDPTTGRELEPIFHTAGLEMVDRAVTAAVDAFSVYGWSAPDERVLFLRTIADRLHTHGESIIQRAEKETALPPGRLRTELGRTCGQLRMFADLVHEGSWVDARIDHGDPDRIPVPKPDVRSMLRPLGPVAVFGASNFPLAFSTAGGDTASALAGGNPVVVKGHPAHPGTAELVARVIVEAGAACGLPEGVFTLLQDAGVEVGKALVKHSGIRAVGFTGSRAGGRALMDLASTRREPIPVFAEMGSINPLFLFPSALRDHPEDLARGVHGSVTLGVGQFCTKPGLVVAEEESGYDRFVSRLSNLMGETTPGFMLHRRICQTYRDGRHRWETVSGVRKLVGTAGDDEGFSGIPALFETDAATFLTQHPLQEELFGPATLIVRSRNAAETMKIAAALEGQLTVTVHGSGEECADRRDLLALLETKAGRVLFGGFPTGVEVGPAMMHGGPYPATSDGRSTSVGTAAIFRFSRRVAYQNMPTDLLPPALQDKNPMSIVRTVNGITGS